MSQTRPTHNDDSLAKGRLSPTPAQYRTYVFVAGLSLALIVFTGAAVRLTDAGLGCENWPTCTDQSLTPEWEMHGLIEFGNRLLSGVVAIAVSLAVLTAYRRQPRRNDLVVWAWGLVVGVLAQIVLGGITVRVDLHPAFVGAHYLLSMVLLWNVVVLWFKASSSGPESTVAVPRTELIASRVAVFAATVVAVLGTVVTGTGPNGGDAEAERLPFVFREVVQIHSVSVWIFLAITVFVAFRLRRLDPAPSNSPITPMQAVQWLLACSLIQGAIGYTQYFRGVPPLLVEFHIIGAVSVWVAAVCLHLSLSNRNPATGSTHNPKS